MRRLLLLLSVTALSACKPTLLPDSSVRDTYENRAVMCFLEDYKEASDARSANDVMDLVAADFFENGGTTGPGDKYGYSILREKLTRTFERVESLNLRLHVQRIERHDNIFDVYYYFVERALVHYPLNTQWITASDFNRMVLRMKGDALEDGFEILSGI